MKIKVTYSALAEIDIEIDKKFEPIAERWYRENNGEYFPMTHEAYQEDNDFCNYLTGYVKQIDKNFLENETMCAIWENGDVIGEW